MGTETVTMPKRANMWSGPNKGDRRRGRRGPPSITKSSATETTKKLKAGFSHILARVSQVQERCEAVEREMVVLQAIETVCH
jgi:hypothetical protein